MSALKKIKMFDLLFQTGYHVYLWKNIIIVSGKNIHSNKWRSFLINNVIQFCILSLHWQRQGIYCSHFEVYSCYIWKQQLASKYNNVIYTLIFAWKNYTGIYNELWENAVTFIFLSTDQSNADRMLESGQVSIHL